MENIGIHFKGRRLIYKLYINERAVIKGRNKSYKEAEIQKGLRQGCNLSPKLFNVYIEVAIKVLREESIRQIIVNGILGQMPCFVDDIAMLVDSEENLKMLLYTETGI